jgi:hypothetical protein
MATSGKLPFPQRKAGWEASDVHAKAGSMKPASPVGTGAPPSQALTSGTPDVELVEDFFRKPESLWAFVGYSDRGASALSPALASAVSFIRVGGEGA